MSSDDPSQGSSSDGYTKYTGPYISQELIANIPLGPEGEEGSEDAWISCVEYWSGNLYVGTSRSVLLHYVLIPAGEGEDQTWIQASRRDLASTDGQQDSTGASAVQQILLLPKVNKACILCNGSTTFYSLPELTPVFTTSKLPNCTWLGGLDENEDILNPDKGPGVVIMIFRKTRILLAKVADRIQTVRMIDIGACQAAARRGDIACVADNTSYSLLDVVQQQRVPLFDVISTDRPEDDSRTEEDLPESIAIENQQALRESEVIATDGPPAGEATANATNVSSATISRLDDSYPPRQSSLETPRPQSRQPSPVPRQRMNAIQPKVLSPTKDEFLLITGTSADEPSVGMFVNLDGEVVPRGTIEFSSFPTSMCLDGDGLNAQAESFSEDPPSEGYVLAVVGTRNGNERSTRVEIKRWDIDPSDSGHHVKAQWLELGNTGPASKPPVGLRRVLEPLDCKLGGVVELLASTRVQLHKDRSSKTSNDQKSDAARERGEKQYISNVAKSQSSVVVWTNTSVSVAVRRPMVLQSEERLSAAIKSNSSGFSVNRDILESVLKDARSHDPLNELEFLSSTYIHHKASLILYMDLLNRAINGVELYERDVDITYKSIVSGELDPRILLVLVPFLQEEIIEGNDGIWVFRGLNTTLSEFLDRVDLSDDYRVYGRGGLRLLHLVKDYLVHWRERKGFASITDADEKSATVDTALVHLMLILDANSPPGRGHKGSIRYELYNIIRQGVDPFDRIRELLEKYERLYVLSLLYQSRKMAREVLATWKRIMDGAHDAGAEFSEGETQIRRYLVQISDTELVKEYATWLANRNPNIGVRVFTDAESRVKFTPEEAVAILKARAPGAVKVFLEHLVFEKNLAAYATDLISYYLDAVVLRLDSSSASREVLLASYREYRALRTPKPTYSQFAADKGDEEWWQNRLRLLQLLGGSHGAASQYDVNGMLKRIQRYEKELVPEMIVLSGRQGQHEEAIRLLVQGLGDFDTAVTYCLLGGSSTYSPTASSLSKVAAPSREQQETLFGYLLIEFLALENINDRIAQTSELLDRFAGWFDPIHVLGIIPDSWSVDLLSGFIETCMRGLVSQRRDTGITKALLNFDNFSASVNLVEKLTAHRPRIEDGVSGEIA